MNDLKPPPLLVEDTDLSFLQYQAVCEFLSRVRRVSEVHLPCSWKIQICHSFNTQAVCEFLSRVRRVSEVLATVHL